MAAVVVGVFGIAILSAGCVAIAWYKDQYGIAIIQGILFAIAICILPILGSL